MLSAVKIRCDFPQCRSYTELADVRDMVDPEKTIVWRGWRCVHPDTTVLHLCPNHKDEQSVNTLLETRQAKREAIDDAVPSPDVP